MKGNNEYAHRHRTFTLFLLWYLLYMSGTWIFNEKNFLRQKIDQNLNDFCAHFHCDWMKLLLYNTYWTWIVCRPFFFLFFFKWCDLNYTKKSILKSYQWRTCYRVYLLRTRISSIPNNTFASNLNGRQTNLTASKKIYYICQSFVRCWSAFFEFVYKSMNNNIEIEPPRKMSFFRLIN